MEVQYAIVSPQITKKIVQATGQFHLNMGGGLSTFHHQKDTASYFFASESGLASPYKTKLRCPEGEMFCWYSIRRPRKERIHGSSTSNHPLYVERWSSIRAPRWDFRPSLVRGRLSMVLWLRMPWHPQNPEQKQHHIKMGIFSFLK